MHLRMTAGLEKPRSLGKSFRFSTF